MKTLLLSICALAVVAAPAFGEEDRDQPKQQKNNRSQTAPPQRPYVAPKTVTPRVQNVGPKPQVQPQAKPPVTARTYPPPKSYTPEIDAKLRNNSPKKWSTVDQDAPRTNNTVWKNDPSLATNNQNWRTRPRTDGNVITPKPPISVTPDTTTRNRNWRDRDRTDRTNNHTNRNWQNNNPNRNRNWQNNTTKYNTYTYDQARGRHHRNWHDRSWWRSRYNRIVLFGGGYYFWDDGYWYPAYGYDPSYSTYAYDEPIYGYDQLPPGQVIANVQSALQEQGYYNDAVDGLIGPNTRAALSNFQRDQGLPITAAIDGPTLQALGLY
jgi:Putative peptidoglycan binding domain